MLTYCDAILTNIYLQNLHKQYISQRKCGRFLPVRPLEISPNSTKLSFQVSQLENIYLKVSFIAFPS